MTLVARYRERILYRLPGGGCARWVLPLTF
jgi:hypothetical protein